MARVAEPPSSSQATVDGHGDRPTWEVRRSCVKDTNTTRELLSGQLGHDRSEDTGDVGSEYEVREADLLTSPEDFLGGRGGITRQVDQRVRGPDGGDIGVRTGHERSDRLADHRHVQRELHGATVVEVAHPL